MTTLMLCAVLAAAAPQPVAAELRPGDTLVLADFSGTVRVMGAERATLVVTDDDEAPVPCRVDRSNGTVKLVFTRAGERGRPEDLRIDLPAWMGVKLSGNRLETRVEGLSGPVSIRAVEGDQVLRRLSGSVHVALIRGGIEADDLGGDAELRSTDGDIEVLRASGGLKAESVQGDIEFRETASPRLSARTTQGEIEYAGRLVAKGVYGFHTHAGDITLRLVPPVHMRGSIMAFGGDIETDIPLRTTAYTSGEAVTFTVGEGHAEVTLESFAGDVELRLAGSD